MQNITIIDSNDYNLTDEKTGREIKGIKCHYIFTDDFAPNIIDNQRMGYQIAAVSLHTDKLSKLKCVPGIYTPRFEMQVNSKGKVEQKLVDVDFVCTVAELFINKK